MKSNLNLIFDATTEAHDRAAIAIDRYGEFASTHEAYGVLAEEVDELLDAIRCNDAQWVIDEAIDVAAVAIRLANEIANRGAICKRSGFDKLPQGGE